MRSTLVRSMLVIAGYWLSWQLSALFEVHPNVSALYFTAGATMAVAILLGWRYLGLSLLTLCLLQALAFPEVGLLDLDWQGALRQVLVYGLAGLLFRSIWLSDGFRLSLPIAMRFLLVAFASSLMSAMITLWIPPFNSLPPELVADVFFSFWGGDFAGVMVTVPIILVLHRAFTLLADKPVRFWPGLIGEYAGLRDVLWLSAMGVAVTVFAIVTPKLLDSDARIDVLILLPVLLAGLLRGSLSGFAVAMMVCLLEVFARPMLGMPVGPSIDLQLLIVMSAAVALLAGAAHDDKQFEWRRANFDALSGLANRSRFEDRLALELKRAARHCKPLALLYLDLDGFKAVNDTFGHRAGDELLREAGRRLSAAVRETDTVARLGGDEFAIILAELGDPEAVDRLAETLLAEIARPYQLGADTARISVSVGIAFQPRDGNTAVGLMHAADQAMYAAKARGKNRFMRHAALGGGQFAD